MEIDQDLARRLLVEGATLVFLNLPVGTEFGIDVKSWDTGEKFKGVKMIPPGIHVIYYSTIGKHGDIAPRVSFIHNFKQSEILVKRWDVDAEDISTDSVSEEELQRFRANLLNLDPYLGVYPFEEWVYWKKLSAHITDRLLGRVLPECGLVRSAVDLIPGPPRSDTPQRRSRSLTVEEKEEALLPHLVPREDSQLRLTPIPAAYPEGASPAQVTQHSLDSSYTLHQMLAPLHTEEELLGELELSFICFLVGQSLEALEAWRRLVRVLCGVRTGLTRLRALYSAFIKVVETQLNFIPEDFLVDIVRSNNVVYTSLRELFRSLADQPHVEPRLKCEAERLKERLTEKFLWSFEDLEEEIGEDAPVIVELS